MRQKETARREGEPFPFDQRGAAYFMLDPT